MAEPQRDLVINLVHATDPEIGRMLWLFQDTRTRTLQSLEGLDPSRVAVVPDHFENSIGALLYHVAVIEADWLYSEVREQEMPGDVLSLFPDGVRDDTGALVDPRTRGLDDHLKVLDQVRALVLETYQPMTLADFRRARQLPQYDVTPEWVLHHLMQHEAEHRGHIESLRHFIEVTSRS
ncbi:MAG: DinB family protein [Nitrolancea sp.]